MALLEVEALAARHGLLDAVREVSFVIEKGESLALVGANGAGKTTLLRTLAGAHRAAGGRIRFAGVDVTGVALLRTGQSRSRAGARGPPTVRPHDR